MPRTAATTSVDPVAAGAVLIEIPQLDVDMYGMAPPVTTMSVVTHWTAAKQDRLTAAVAEVVRANPPLAGRLEGGGAAAAAGAACRVVLSGVHPRALVKVIEGPPRFAPKPELLGRIRQVHDELEGLVVEHGIKGIAVEQIGTDTDLFMVLVITLPHGYACIAPMVNHLIADGHTYYTLVGHISAVMEGTPVQSLPKLRWAASPSACISPAHYTEHDKWVTRASWVPACAKVMAAMPERTARWLLADRAEIDAIKKEQLAAQRADLPRCDFLSTNDVISAGVSEIFNTRIVNIIVNMRGRVGGVGPEMAGNAQRLVCAPREKVAGDPAFIRREILNTGKFYGYEPGELPEDAFADFDISGLTNWVQLTTFLQFDDSETVAHVPLSAFTVGVPLEIGVIFKASSSGEIGFLCSFHESPDFRERVARSTIFRRIFDMAAAE